MADQGRQVSLAAALVAQAGQHVADLPDGIVNRFFAAQFTALRYSALDGTDHDSHKEQASMIRRYIIWRNNHAYDERLRRIIDRANVA